MSLAGERIAIAGGGIIGLAAALELARCGARVTVYERDVCMQQASWAAAGMLAVDDPENDPRLLPLSQLSRSLYPGFLADVERLSGLPVPLRTRRTVQAEGQRPVPDEPLQFHTLDEASLDPRDLCRALPVAVRAAGVTIHEETAVTHAAADGDGVRVSTKNHAAFETDRFLLAAGAWSGQISVRGSSPLPVSPCKGQMIEVLLPENGPVLEQVMRSTAVYLVPRTGRRIAIGATVEQAGFDRTLSAEAAQTLLTRAGAVWPPVRTAAVTAQWSGLRPMPQHAVGLPFFGPLDDARRLWTATGHFRNGILLAPATARMLAAMMDGQPTPVDPSPFDPRGMRSAATDPALP